VPRGEDAAVDTVKARLSTVDITSGEAVQLDKLIGTLAYDELKNIVLDELGQGLRQMIALLDLERTVRTSFAVAPSATPGSLDLIIGVPASGNGSLTCLTFRISRDPAIENAVQRGFFVSSPRVHEDMLIRLHQFETVPREGILSDIRVLSAGAPNMRRELLCRGWELRSKLYDGWGPAEGWDLRDMTGKRAGQKIRFYDDGSISFTTFTPELTETIRVKDERVENTIWDNEKKRDVMGSELSRLLPKPGRAA
jgi:hypothetical protein